MNTDFTLIQIKRSNVPGRVPTVDDLELGELAINTYDAKIYAKRYRQFVGTDIIAVGGSGPDIANVLYVTADGNDSNSGKNLETQNEQLEQQLLLQHQEQLLRLVLEII